MKPFEAPQRIVKVEIWVSFLLIRLYEMPGVGRVKGGMIPICYDLYCNFWEDFVEQFFLHGRPILTRKFMISQEIPNSDLKLYFIILIAFQAVNDMKFYAKRSKEILISFANTPLL